MNRPHKLKDMTPGEVAACLEARPVVLVPAGTLEPRGPHLPLGSDTIILEHLADDVSAATGILRAPALDYGVHQTGDPSCPGIASLSRKTLHRAINELIASWETVAKVRKIIILTAHAAEAHQEALSTIRTIGEVNLVDIFDLDFSAEVSPPVGTVNGGIIATSILLHLAPTVVAPPPFSGATPELGERLYRRVRDRVIDRLR